MPQHITHFRSLIEQSDAFYNALYRLHALEEIGNQNLPDEQFAHNLEEYRQAAQAALAALRKALDTIEREHGLRESEAGNG